MDVGARAAAVCSVRAAISGLVAVKAEREKQGESVMHQSLRFGAKRRVQQRSNTYWVQEQKRAAAVVAGLKEKFGGAPSGSQVRAE